VAEVTRRKVVTYRWICIDKDRCEQIDNAMEQLVFHSSQLSHYVECKEISGLECLVLTGKLKWALIELRNERKTLWRRVPKITEEEVATTILPQPVPTGEMGTKNDSRSDSTVAEVL
jgi:hypothetical protein